MRLERQIAELQALEAESGKPLGARERTQLEDAQRDLARVKKARETVGAPPRAAATTGEGGRGGRGRGDGLGKRRRGSTRARESEESEEETDDSVRRIPMPRDTPPPIPRPARPRSSLTNANREPLGRSARLPAPPVHDETTTHDRKPAAPPQTVYESKPVVRDLRKEAVEKFVPVAVQRKLDARRGEGGRLLEEEEMSRLEKEGYGGRKMKGEVDEKEKGSSGNQMGQDEREERRRREAEMSRLREEEERFERELALEDDGKLG